MVHSQYRFLTWPVRKSYLLSQSDTLPVQTVPQSGPERFRQNLGNSWTAYSVQCLFKLAARHAALHQGCPPLTINIFEASPTDL